MKKRKIQEIINGNRIGIVFKCGCRFPLGVPKQRNREQHVICPVHGERIRGYIFKCYDCGRFFEDNTLRRARCQDCTEDHRLDYLCHQYQKRKKRRAEEREERYIEDIKPIETQVRRGDCMWGQYCVNTQCKTGVVFNCHNCIRFERIEDDVMEFVETSKECWCDQMEMY